MRLIIFLSFSLFTIFGLKAQNSRNVEEIDVPALQYKASKKKAKKGFSLLKKKELTDREEHEAFRERIASNQKKKIRELKKADKPQYTDPLYFGHKKPPKKRKNGKKKFCKECGLVH